MATVDVPTLREKPVRWRGAGMFDKLVVGGLCGVVVPLDSHASQVVRRGVVCRVLGAGEEGKGCVLP